jgi:hypothetical protein
VEILEEHQALIGLEEKHRPHMQLFDTEEKDKKRQESQLKNEQSMTHTVKGLGTVKQNKNGKICK